MNDTQSIIINLVSIAYLGLLGFAGYHEYDWLLPLAVSPIGILLYLALRWDYLQSMNVRGVSWPKLIRPLIISQVVTAYIPFTIGFAIGWLLG